MFHPPKLPQQQQNGNETGLQWVPIAKPSKTDLTPIALPFFSCCWPLLAVVDPMAIVEATTGFINLLNYNE